MIAAVALGAVVALDQGTKALIVRLLPAGGSLSRHPFGIRICHLRNAHPGAGIVRSPNVLVVVWILIGCALPLLLTASGSLALMRTQIALGMVMGGTLGNLLDRAARGAVIDVIDLRVWPVFNLADSAIVLGTALMVWSLLS